MPDRTSHPPGAFSWAELVTSDPEAAKAFYASFLGWTYEDAPLPMGGVYSMAKIRGRSAAAIFEGPAGQGPPHWNAYITVASVAETAERAAGLGATVVAPPFDVMDAGRMVVVQDPAGVYINFWEPRRHIGAEIVNEHGALTWNEIATRDAEPALSFYRDLLGWEFEPIEQAPFPMWLIRLGGRPNGNVREMGGETPAEVPPHVLDFFAVDDIGAAVDAAQAGGGRLMVGPQQVPAGTFAVLNDPEGAVFGLFAGEVDD
jgi:predicted enzyme related to lactoylglutathione lyase